MKNAMTVDVEEYFQVSAFEGRIQRNDWSSWPSRVERNTELLLELFESRNIHATFFTLGWVAERHPGLIDAIVRGGHELACHGLDHTRITDMTPEQFRTDISTAKAKLEDRSGRAVIGYRAPSFSIVEHTRWAWHEIRAAGFVYSASVYPIHHDLYGMPDAPRFPHVPDGTDLLEIPTSTREILGRRLPIGGGGYFRLLPLQYYRWNIAYVNQQESAPCNFYCHPWEFDPDQPRVDGTSFKSRFRHYYNLGASKQRLERLLDLFEWDTMAGVYLEREAAAAA